MQPPPPIITLQLKCLKQKYTLAQLLYFSSYIFFLCIVEYFYCFPCQRVLFYILHTCIADVMCVLM